LPISIYFHPNFKTVIFFEGIIITAFSLYFSIEGNPSGINITGLGNNSAQYIANKNLETTKRERETTGYYQNFKKHAVAELTFIKLTIVFGGILLILCGIFI
jgi:hypothetical protein